MYQWIATSRITILAYLWTALGAIALVAFPIGQLIWPVPIVEELKPLHLTIAGPVRIYSASRVGRWKRLFSFASREDPVASHTLAAPVCWFCLGPLEARNPLALVGEGRSGRRCHQRH